MNNNQWLKLSFIFFLALVARIIVAIPSETMVPNHEPITVIPAIVSGQPR